MFQPKKREDVVYTSGHGGEFTARVKTVHQDGSWTVNLQFPIRGAKLVSAFQGDLTYRVGPSHIAGQTKDGILVSDLAF
jgi:hypothetical protein